MKALDNLTIKRKLMAIILSISLLALGCGFAVVIIIDVRDFKQDMTQNTIVNARLVGEYCVSPLVFEDRVGAENVLKRLQAIPSIVGGRLLDGERKVFAAYGKVEDVDAASAAAHEFSGDKLYVSQPVRYGEQRYGTIVLVASTEELRSKITRYILTMVALMLGLMVLCFFVASRLQAVITRPIFQLVAATKEVSERADYSKRVEKRGNDELAVLCDGFNSMIETIETREKERDEVQKQLLTYQEKLEDLVKERTAELEQTNVVLGKSNRDLETVNREMEAFSYSVAHDLRAPLRAIEGFSKILLKDYLDVLDDQGKDYLQRASRASQKMARLIDDLLTLARVSRAKLRSEPVDLSAMAGGIMTGLKETEPGRDVDVVLTENLTAVGDSKLLNQALENLLGNAWKYTGKRSDAKVEFGAVEQEGATSYFVRDNGAGFEMKYAANILMPFHRLHSEMEFPGTGIGLSTVDRIIKRHGGRVWFESTVDQGATFFFTLGEHTEI
jgi:signal transduction histidine kinase